jgi:hypothetical protein
MVERPKFSDAFEVRDQDGQSTGTRLRARTIWGRIAGSVGARVPARREKALPQPTGAQDARAIMASGGSRKTPTAIVFSAAAALMRAMTASLKPGLVTVMSVVAAIYVIIALSSSPTAIGIDAVAPTATTALPLAPSPSPSLAAEVQPDLSGEQPAAIAAPEAETSVALVGPASDPLVAATAPAQTAALPEPDLALPDVQAAPLPALAGPASDPLPAATAPAQTAALPEPDLAQPDMPGDAPAALAMPAVGAGRAALPAAAPLPSAIAPASPRLEAMATPGPVTPLPAEVVAAPAAARPAVRPAPRPATIDVAPVVSSTDPARLASPALSADAAAPPAAVAESPAEETPPPRLPDVADDAPVLAAATPFAPVVPGFDLSPPGLALSPTAETATMNRPAPMAAVQSRIAAIEDGALMPIAPDGLVNVALAPPAPLERPAEGAQGPNAAAGFDGVFVRVAVPGTVPDPEVEALVGVLQDVGLGDGRFTRVNFTVTETHVRYYLPADAEAAATLGEIIGADVRDHTNFRPSPPDGTLEIYIAGDSAAPPPRAAASQRASAPQRARPPAPEDEMTRMRNNILNRLRSGG